jgi:broad specificity phosphatase PhoE
MLLLVRHGQSEANLSGLLVGRLDSPLTDLGRRQAAAIGAALAMRAARTETAPRRVISSPLGRARETAEAIAAAFVPLSEDGLPHNESITRPIHGAGLEIDDRFIELDYGDLDGTAPSELPAELWTAWRSDSSWRPPGGETLEEVNVRVARACADLADEAARGDVVIVSHVSPIKAAVAWALGGGAELSWKLSLGVASITRITTGSNGPALVSFNESAHLAGA